MGFCSALSVLSFIAIMTLPNTIVVAVNDALSAVWYQKMLQIDLGLNYHRQGSECPAEHTIFNDLRVIHESYGHKNMHNAKEGITHIALKTYAVHECDTARIIMRAVQRYNAQHTNTCFLLQIGLWIDDNQTKNENEQNAIIEIYEEEPKLFENVIGIHFGTETIFRGELTAKQITHIIEKGRQAFKHAGIWRWPITTAEVHNKWEKQMVEAVDFVMIHVYPFFQNISIEHAPSFVMHKVKRMHKKYGDHVPIVVGETGWPSEGRPLGKSVPSPLAMQKYYEQVTCLARQKKLPVYFFEAFDESWKPAGEQHVEPHFGLLLEDRYLKWPLESLKVVCV